jgi:hypothetical protein
LAHNKLYRNFIILQEDERGYSHSSDKALSGYAKVEAKGDKCKVSFYAQNLRQEDNYSMVLICCKRDLKQLIDLGPLSINGVGKGDTSKDYYVNNIAGLGISYEKVSGAAICRTKDNETEFIMHGFMNGEDSTDNWRKFKIVKVDSKKYINKLDEEPKRKDIPILDIHDKVIIAKANNEETKIVKTSKLESGLVERKKDEKENIESDDLNSNNSKVEDKQQNRIPEEDKNINENINVLDEDRNKCKEAMKYDKCEKNEHIEETKKCGKCEKNEHMEENKKCDKHEMNENIEEVINKLAKKLETYDGVIDLRINNVHEDVIIYGFIKDKKNCNCKWKKFKIEKKCRSENEDFNNVQGNSKRIEENFNLDKLNEVDSTDGVDRLDIIDFDEYENDIQQAGTGNMGQTSTGTVSKISAGNMGQTGTGNMGQTNTGTVSKISAGNMGQTSAGTVGQTGTGNMGQTSTGTVGQTSAGTVGQTGTGNMGQTSTGTIGQTGTGNMGQTSAGTVGQTSTGTVGQTGTGNMGQTSAGIVGQTNAGNMDQTGLGAMWQPIGQPSSSNMQQSTSNQDFNMNGEVGQYFEKLAENFEPYNGSLVDINYCKLYKINVNSIEDLSDESNYNQYTLAYYPMLNYYPYISKEGYFLLGYKCNGNGEMKYIVYAIPGSKEKSDQPYGGRTGFVTWTSDNKNGIGYWLMFYDFKNSTIVIPTK